MENNKLAKSNRKKPHPAHTIRQHTTCNTYFLQKQVKANMTLQGTCVHAYVYYTYVCVLVSLCIYFYVITVQ